MNSSTYTLRPYRQFSAGLALFLHSKFRRGLVGSAAQGSDKNLSTIQGQSLKVGQVRRTGLPAHARKAFIVTLLALFPLIMGKTGQAQQVGVDSNTVIVDLNQLPQDNYKVEVLSKCQRGARPGEFGIENTNRSIILPGPVAVDKMRNIYIYDQGNNRVQEFDENGKFRQVLAKKLNAGEVFGSGIKTDLKGTVYLDQGQICWETKKGKIVKHVAPKKGGYFHLADGILWSCDPDDNMCSSSGRKEKISSLEWRLDNGLSIVRHTANQEQWEFDFLGSSPLRGKRIIFKAKNLSVSDIRMREGNAYLYFNGIVSKPEWKEFTCEVRLRDMSTRVITLPHIIGRRLALADDGNLYGINAGEAGEMGSGNFYCEIVKASPNLKQ